MTFRFLSKKKSCYKHFYFKQNCTEVEFWNSQTQRLKHFHPLSKCVWAAPEIVKALSLYTQKKTPGGQHWSFLQALLLALCYTSPIVWLFLFRPLKYGHKFTKGTCSPLTPARYHHSAENIVKISKGSGVWQGRGINSVMISPEFLPGDGVTWKQHKWWHILT